MIHLFSRLCFVLFFLKSAVAFSAQTGWRAMHRKFTTLHPRQQSSTSLSMCICIDCARVTNCAAYHFVEEKHEQPHMTENPTFTPQEGSPTIHVNVRTNRQDKDDQVQRMWSEHKDEEEAASKDAKSGDLHGNTVYDFAPVTTVEYDVVACADFVEEKGCWVANMPDEIRAANPDFVPT